MSFPHISEPFPTDLHHFPNILAVSQTLKPIPKYILFQTYLSLSNFHFQDSLAVSQILKPWDLNHFPNILASHPHF